MLSWLGSLVGRKRKKVWRALPYCVFSEPCGKRETKEHLKNIKQLVHSLKNSFVINLLSCVRMHIVERTLSLFEFVDWMGSI